MEPVLTDERDNRENQSRYFKESPYFQEGREKHKNTQKTHRGEKTHLEALSMKAKTATRKSVLWTGGGRGQAGARRQQWEGLQLKARTAQPSLSCFSVPEKLGKEKKMFFGEIIT